MFQYLKSINSNAITLLIGRVAATSEGVRDWTDYVLGLMKKNFTGNYSKKLAEKAIKEGSTDNVTVVVMFLS